jgi:hypothetical protein
MENNVSQIIELAQENALLNRALTDLLFVLNSKDEKRVIIAGSGNPIIHAVFTEVFKLKGWSSENKLNESELNINSLEGLTAEERSKIKAVGEKALNEYENTLKQII